jgi:Flp pilus assembly CpaE family ATPase
MSATDLPYGLSGQPPGPVAVASAGADWELALIPLLERPRSGLHLVRRCVDVADLLAVARAGLITVAVVSARLTRLEREHVSQLRSDGVAVLLVEDDEHAGSSLRLGVSDVVGADVSAQDILARGRALAERSTDAPAVGADIAPAATSRGADGRLVAVWGPHGAPGRTTVAVNLAVESARAGVSTMLVDADAAGGAVSTALGVLDEAPGLAAACRSAARGRLDAQALAAHALSLDNGLRVLTGSTRPDRWGELRPSGLESVWTSARCLADVVVADLAAGLPGRDVGPGGCRGPEDVSASVIDAADIVVVLGRPDPVGMVRLVHALDQLGERWPSLAPVVVVNRVRASVVGRDPAGQVRDTLGRLASRADVHVLPDDARAADDALRRASSLSAVAPDSALAAAVAGLAATVLPDMPEPRSGAVSRDRRRRRRRSSVPSVT